MVKPTDTKIQMKLETIISKISKLNKQICSLQNTVTFTENNKYVNESITNM